MSGTAAAYRVYFTACLPFVSLPVGFDLQDFKSTLIRREVKADHDSVGTSRIIHLGESS